MSATTKKQYLQSFRDEYTKEYPCIIKSDKGSKFAFCTFCRCDLNISHGGKNDLATHMKSNKHCSNVKVVEDNRKIRTFFGSSTSDNSVIKAECLFTAFLLEHNIPLSAADHAGSLFRKMFPNSEEVKKYACGRTKTTAIVSELADNTRDGIIQNLRSGPYSVATDGTNDTDSKIYPLVVTFFDKEAQDIVSCVVSLPELKGESTGRNIGNLVVNELQRLNVPISNMIAFSADNAAVMMGCRNGAVAVLKEKQENLIVIGCLCHLINLAAEKGTACLNIKVDEILVDTYYYLEKSSKRKDSLKKFQGLHGEEAKKVLKHVSTRWLSLGKCLKRLLEEWDPLLSFFREQVNAQKPQHSGLSSFVIPKKAVVNQSSICKAKVDAQKPESPASTASGKKYDNCSEGTLKTSISHQKNVSGPTGSGHQSSSKKVLSGCGKGKQLKPMDSIQSCITREEKLFMVFSCPYNKAICLFLVNVIPLFEKFNVILQSSVPQIHKLHQLISELLKELLIRFVKPSVLKSSALLEVKYHCIENQRQDQDLIVGSVTSLKVSELKESDKEKFFSSVRTYYTTSCDYIVNKFPFKNEVINRASVAAVEHISEASFCNIKFFVDLFPFLLSVNEDESREQALDELQNQFALLQLEDISSVVNKEDSEVEKWVKISRVLNVSGQSKYGKICSVMLAILTIPHSNAECERVFSLVKKNRTQFRSQMSTEVLEDISIVKCKTFLGKRCFEQCFSDTFLQKAKKATVKSLARQNN